MHVEEIKNAGFIWLPEDRYPRYQLSKQTLNAPAGDTLYAAAEFKKSFYLPRTPKSARITVFADTKYLLCLNGEIIGTGPVNSGGDFITDKSLPLCYYSTFEAGLKEGENEIFVEVSIMPCVHTETSRGRGGLVLVCKADYGDKTTVVAVSDGSWLCRRNTARQASNRLDLTQPPDTWIPAAEIKSVWELLPSPIPVLSETPVLFSEIIAFDEFKSRITVENGKITVKNGCPLTFIAKFDMIYSAYSSFNFKGGRAVIQIGFQEILGKTHASETILTNGDCTLRGWGLQSVGYMSVTVTFCDKRDCVFDSLGAVYTHFPTYERGSFECDDEGLNEIYRVCAHTAEICRQSLHLDSPLHQELLACTGDYFVESLIDCFAFGDTSLTRFDIVRTCDLLRMTGGEMFHTSYSLILLQMITNYYKYSGDAGILRETFDALTLLLSRFEGYTRYDGIIDNAPNYMFVEHWEIDGYSLHHPPKALGQALLNAYYYKALTEMEYICSLTGYEGGEIYTARAKKLKESFNQAFWDDERGLYCDGLTTPEEANGYWRPANTDKKYFSRHTNTLAVLYKIAPEEQRAGLMEKIMTDDSLFRVQPYFMHYVFEALSSVGLFGKYGLAELRKWSELLGECPMGLKEVWTGFDCDFSHAWGGTPVYQLASKLLGLEILEPGYKKIKLRPELFGLSWARIRVPTPFGFIEADLNAQSANKLSVPPGIVYSIMK